MARVIRRLSDVFNQQRLRRGQNTHREERRRRRRDGDTVADLQGLHDENNADGGDDRQREDHNGEAGDDDDDALGRQFVVG